MVEEPTVSALTLPLAGSIERAHTSPGSSPLADEVASLFDELRDRLLRYVLSLGLPVQDGEEIIQEVFLSLFRHLQRGKSRSNLRGWVFRVAHNLTLKRLNRSRNDIQRLADEAFNAECFLIDPNPSPEDEMASTQKRKRLLAIIGALPEQDRRCLVLRAEGLRYREISAVLDISLGTVSLSLERSLARLVRAVER
jgi:RNA polymerase sigma-70 factor (ECF subfamily)